MITFSLPTGKFNQGLVSQQLDGLVRETTYFHLGLPTLNAARDSGRYILVIHHLEYTVRPARAQTQAHVPGRLPPVAGHRSVLLFPEDTATAVPGPAHSPATRESTMDAVDSSV